VAAVVVLLIVWIAIDYRRQKERLRELEASWRDPALRPPGDGHLMSTPAHRTNSRAADAGWWRCR
jgi:hypothetical protein